MVIALHGESAKACVSNTILEGPRKARNRKKSHGLNTDRKRMLLRQHHTMISVSVRGQRTLLVSFGVFRGLSSFGCGWRPRWVALRFLLDHVTVHPGYPGALGLDHIDKKRVIARYKRAGRLVRTGRLCRLKAVSRSVPAGCFRNSWNQEDLHSEDC